MLQEILVWLLFALSLAYVCKLLYSSFRPGKSVCPKGCGSCALDIKKLEEQVGKSKDEKFA